MTEICFIIQMPLTQRDYERLQVERFRQWGYQVSFLDMTFLLNRQVMEKKVIQSLDYEYVYTVKSAQDIDQFFTERKGRRWFLIDFIGRPETEPLLEKYFKADNVIYGNFCNNSIPKVRYQPLWRMLCSYRCWQRLIWRLKKSFLSSSQKLMPVKFVIAGGLYDQHKFPQTDEKTKIIWAHTLDYDLYLNYQAHPEKPLVKEHYAVFLDECFLYHPDFHLSDGPKNPFRLPEEYYSEINQFFTAIEKKMNLKVVIAAHPKAPYENMPNLFDGRTVIKGKTIDLVAHARCVLCHCSTSINFAVMFRKPLIFLLPSKVKGQFYERVITAFAGQFKQKPWDIKSIQQINVQKTLEIDDKIYQEYQETFIKRVDTPQKFYADIVSDAFDQMVNSEPLKREMREYEKESISR